MAARRKVAPKGEQETMGGSLRDRQRLLTQNAALDAACDLFATVGYQKTTMQMIADRSQIGIATLFRHFGKKATVLAEIMRRDIEATFSESRQIVDAPPPDPLAGFEALFKGFSTILDRKGKKLRINPHLWPAVATGRPEADEVVHWADQQVSEQILSLLQHYQDANLLADELDLHDTSAILFFLFNGHYVEFLSGRIKSRAEFNRKISARLNLLFHYWK